MLTGLVRTLTARWQVAALITGDIVVLKVILAVAAIIRAEDYAHGTGDRFGMLEAAMPMAVWTLGCLTVGSLILTGIVWQAHFTIWLGHALGAGLYLLLALANVGAAFDGWPPEGESALRSAIPGSVWAAAHAALAVAVLAGAAHARGAYRREAVTVAGLTLVLIVGVIAIADMPTDGIRTATPLLLMATLHYQFMIRSGPRPMTRDDAKVVEETTAPGGA